MRPKIVIAIVFIGLAGIFAALFLKRPPANPNPSPAPAAETASQPDVPKMAATSNAETIARNPPVAVAPAVADTNEDTSAHDAYLQARLDKLTQLQANDDPESLHEILGELTNSEKVIRMAAVQSAIQFGSRDAIPVLTNLAVQTSDPREKKALLDAADFLELPSWTEIHKQNPHAKIIGVVH
jgi:type IV secretory pathway VirB10-like protein